MSATKITAQGKVLSIYDLKKTSNCEMKAKSFAKPLLFELLKVTKD